MDEKDKQIEAMRARLEVAERAYHETLKTNQALREALKRVLTATAEHQTAEICREALITQ